MIIKLQGARAVCLLALLAIQINVSNAQKISEVTKELNQISLESIFPDIDSKTVLLIGEPTHGEGTFQSINGLLVERVVKEKDFKIVAFESGFYELWKASRFKRDSANYALTLRKAIYPIWSASKEFQPLLDFLVQNRDSIQAVGFDFQFTQLSADYLVDDLKYYLGAEVSEPLIDYDYLQEVIDYMAFNSILPVEYDQERFEKLITNVTSKLEQKAGGDQKFWIQCVSNILSLTTWYHDEKIAEKTEETFKATNSNARDLAMAENLLFWLDYYPNHKAVCWGAAPHFAYKTDVLNDEELQHYLPMGHHLQLKLGQSVTNMGAISGGGAYGYHFESPKNVILSDPNLLESSLSHNSTHFNMVNWDLWPDSVTTQAFQYEPVKGVWRSVFDQMLFVKEISPTTIDTLVYDKINRQSLPSVESADVSISTLEEVENTESTLKEASKNNTQYNRRHLVDANSISGDKVESMVLDSETGKPVPFATIRVRNTGTASRGDGRFTLNIPQAFLKDSVHITCIGYNPKHMLLSELQNEVRLEPKTETLSNVMILGERYDAREIYKKALLNIPDNYLQKRFNARFATQAQGYLSNDTAYMVNYHTTSSLEKGYQPVGQDRPMILYGHRNVDNTDWIKLLTGDARRFGQTFLGDNVVRAMPEFQDLGQHPIFQLKNIKKMSLSLDSVINTHEGIVYAIGFKVKKARYRLTNTFYDQSFYGNIYISDKDFAILRTEMIWVGDNEKLAHFSDRYYKKPGDLFFLKYDNDISMEICEYQKMHEEKYYLVYNERIAQKDGIDLRNDKPYSLFEKVTADLVRIDLEGELVEENQYLVPLPPGHVYESSKHYKRKK